MLWTTLQSCTGATSMACVEQLPVAAWQGWWRVQAATLQLSAAAASGFVLSTAQLSALGVSRAQARTRVRRGEWTVPRPGYVAPLHLDASTSSDRWLIERRRHALAASAASHACHAQVVAGLSAAVLHGLPTFRTATDPELLVRPAARSGPRSAVHARRAGLRRNEVQAWFGTPVTTVSRTLVDVARHDRRDGLVAADAALREGLMPAVALADALDRARGWPGAATARAVLALASGLSESVLESLLRLALHDDGFPPPQLQAPIVVPGRLRPCRVDVLWREARLIVEADGRSKYTGDELWREKRREAQLRALGYRVERVLWADVVHTWPATRRLLWDALATQARLYARGG